MTQDSWLAFTPRDTVFIRDGRSFDAAADAAAQAVRPGPSTVAGAVGAAFGVNPLEVRGPVLARAGSGCWEPYFPVPADLVCTADATAPYVFRLSPADGLGATDLEPAPGSVAGLRWLVPPDEAEPAAPARGWLPAAELAGYLAGDLVPAGGTPLADLDLAGDPLWPERRVGLARDDQRRARTGYLYQTTHLRPEDGWAFLAQCVTKPGWEHQATGPVPLGGRGRLADVAPATVSWPAFPAGRVGKRVLVYLATPALWPGGWQIPVPPGAALIAAATGEPEPVATLTPGPQWARTRMLRWAVPAGSVYLLEFSDAARGAAWASTVHGTAYGREATDLLRTAGFGVVLTGAWT